MSDRPLTIQRIDTTFIVAVEGPCDLTVVSELDAGLSHLLDIGGQNVIVDMQGLEFITSSMASILVRYTERFQSKDAKLKVCSANPHVHHILDLLGLSKILSLFDDKTGALLASPDDVRKRLGICDRRQGADRRRATNSVQGKDRRKATRRHS